MEVDGSSPRHESENEGDISNRGPILHVGQGFEGVPRGKILITEICGPTEKNMVSALEMAIEANSTAQATCNILSPAVARIQEQTDSMAQSIDGLVSDGDQTHYQVLALRSRLEAVERSLETLRGCSDRSQERVQNHQNAPLRNRPNTRPFSVSLASRAKIWLVLSQLYERILPRGSTP